MNSGILSVAINADGAVVIGGESNTDFQWSGVAMIPKNGDMISIDFKTMETVDQINSVAINAKGKALIGGVNKHETTPHIYTLSDLPTFQTPYAALVSSNGSIEHTIFQTDGSPSPGVINSVAMTTDGPSIIGGNLNNCPYVALISSDGYITGTPLQSIHNAGDINSVAINDSETAIVGGFFESGGGVGLAFGFSGNTYPYATLISNGIAGKDFFADDKGYGAINSVAINADSKAIVGGNYNDMPYAGRIVNGTLYPVDITFAPEDRVIRGDIKSVAINIHGASAICGLVTIEDPSSSDEEEAATVYSYSFPSSGYAPYAALIAPDGSVTPISGFLGNGAMFGIAIPAILDATVPTSFGAGNNYFSALLPGINFLSDHLSQQLTRSTYTPENHVAALRDIPPVPASCKRPPYTLWAGFVGSQVTQQKEKETPKTNDWIGGALLGFDYQSRFSSYDFCVGGAAAYSFAYVHPAHQGHAKINQESLAAYGSVQGRHFFIETALWGGVYQTSNDRDTLGIITSKSHYHGWLLVPHLELDLPFEVKNNDTFTVLLSPFARVDWANNWQGKIREHGSAGFNLMIDDQYTSLLRSEVGLRFFEEFTYGWGRFVLEEKCSYVNKKPFHTQLASALFVGSISPFMVETFSSETQNLGAGQLSLFFLPCNPKYPYGQMNYLCELGSGFVSNTLSLEIGKRF